MPFLQSTSQRKPTAKVALFALGIACALTAGLAVDGQAASTGDRAKASQQARELAGRIQAGQASNAANHSVSCHPSDYLPGVCPEALIKACKKYGGTMSTSPNGTHTCSGPYTGPK